jgi:hypothetical protein
MRWTGAKLPRRVEFMAGLNVKRSPTIRFSIFELNLNHPSAAFGSCTKEARAIPAAGNGCSPACCCHECVSPSVQRPVPLTAPKSRSSSAARVAESVASELYRAQSANRQAVMHGMGHTGSLVDAATRNSSINLTRLRQTSPTFAGSERRRRFGTRVVADRRQELQEWLEVFEEIAEWRSHISRMALG